MKQEKSTAHFDTTNLVYHCRLSADSAIKLILRFGSIMSVGYEKVYLMQNNINLVQREVISTYIYKVGLKSADSFSYGTAIGLFNSVINCTLLVIVNKLAKQIGEGGYSLW